MEDRGIHPRRANDARFYGFGRVVEASAGVGLGFLDRSNDKGLNFDRLVRVFVAPYRYVSRFLEGVDAHVVRNRYVRVRRAVFKWLYDDLSRNFNYLRRISLFFTFNRRLVRRIVVSETLRLHRVVVLFLRVDCRRVNGLRCVSLANEGVRFGAFYAGIIRRYLGMFHVRFFYFCVREGEVSTFIRGVRDFHVNFFQEFRLGLLAGRPLVAVLLHTSWVERFSKGHVNYFGSFRIFRPMREFCLRSFIYLPGRFLLGVDSFRIDYSLLRPLLNKGEEGV